MTYPSTRIAIIGAGAVGATIAYAAAIKGIADEIVIIDLDHNKAVAQASDIMHGSMFLPPVEVTAGSMKDCKDAQIVVITAGAKQATGQTRLELAASNARMVREVVPSILEVAPAALLLMVSNPVDVLTYAALRVSGVPSHRIIGSGTVLDTSRFRSLLAARLNVSISNVHAYIVGEHGDSEVPLWSSSTVANVPIANFSTSECASLNDSDREELFGRVRNAAGSIIAAKGATNWAVGLSVSRVMSAIIRDENAVLTVSRLLNNYHGIDDVCLSVPSIVGRNGLGALLPVDYSDEEIRALRTSAGVLKEAAQSLGF
jgi:L-lactate dehydrogenase